MGIVLSVIAACFLASSLISSIIPVTLPLIEKTGIFGTSKTGSRYAVSHYCEDITSNAKKKSSCDIVGREPEVDCLTDILCSESKGNPCIVGEPGVGKTALTEKLAYKIISKKVPKELENKKILKINTARLLTEKSLSYKNNSLRYIQLIFEKAKSDKNIILFIDDFHHIVQCGAADLLKIYLDKGDFNVIVSVTSGDYAYIAQNPALERKFTKVTLKEPTPFETLEILKKFKSEVEKKNKVKILDSALTSAVELTGRYMKNKTYPHKAIKIINLAIKMVSRMKSEETASEVSREISVTPTEIKECVARETGIPICDLTDEEAASLKNMGLRINKHVVGQEEAVEKVCESVLKNRAGLTVDGKPRASFLFTGLAGVGKTALAEILGEEIGSIIRLDMSRYSTKKSQRELIGDKIYDRKDELLEKVTQKPYSVVLFDGIEKAHPNVLNIISEMLGNGYITDPYGNKVDFSSTTVIITSSLGSDVILRHGESFIDENIKKEVLCEAEKFLGREFFSRIDQTLVFNNVSKVHFKKIIDMLLVNLENKLGEQNIFLEVEEGVKDYLSDTKEDLSSGVRCLKKIAEEKMEVPIAKLIVEKSLAQGDKLTCKMENGEITFIVNK